LTSSTHGSESSFDFFRRRAIAWILLLFLIGRSRAGQPQCLGRVLETIARPDVLLVDDFAMAPLNDGERRDFLEICDDRYGPRSTILTSQLTTASWHAQIGDPTVADSISTGSCITPIESR
jgi:hypothetical protein